MPRTQNDLVVEVLDLLNVTQTGQDPAAEDVEKVESGIPGLYDELARRQILYVQNRGAIDEEYFDSLATILASRVGRKFGLPRDRDAERVEESKLRDINRGPGAYDTLATEFI